MSLQSVQYCVFDEADQLFEMGFAEQMKAILSSMGEARQTLLFSATLPAALAEFARAGTVQHLMSFVLVNAPILAYCKALHAGGFDQSLRASYRTEESSFCTLGC